MTTPRGARPRDLEERLRELEARVSELTSAALRREQLGVTQGDFAVSGGGNIVVRDGGDIEILDDAGTVVWSALDGPMKVRNVQKDADTAIPNDNAWHTYLSTNITVPAGFTQAQVMLATTAGRTLSSAGSGFIGVWPQVNAWAGPAISSGAAANMPVSVTSYVSQLVTDLSGGLTVSLKAYCNGAASASGSTNVHLAATVLFLR